MDTYETQFQVMLDAELRVLDGQLGSALSAAATPAPALLIEALAELAPGDDLAALEVDLRSALAAQAPAGLVDRVYAATAKHLSTEAGHRTAPVIGRIGPAIWGALATAAAIMLMASLWWLDPVAPPAPNTGPRLINIATATIELERFVDDAHLAGSIRMDLDGDMAALALDIEGLAAAVDSDVLTAAFASRIGELEDDLLFAETEFDVF